MTERAVPDMTATLARRGGRTVAVVDPDRLRTELAEQGLTHMGLAMRLLDRGDPLQACSAAMIGHWVTGRRQGAAEVLARAVEAELGLPAGAVFEVPEA